MFKTMAIDTFNLTDLHNTMINNKHDYHEKQQA